MKRIFLILGAAALVLAGCAQAPAAEQEVVNIIFDTDIGNDIDDTEALDILFKYQDEGKINLMGICLNKTGIETEQFTGVMCKWYGYPDTPVGMVGDGTYGFTPASECYTGKALRLTNEDGTPVFEKPEWDYGNLPEACALYRKLLAEAEDNSVTIVSVGFLTNLFHLINSPADEISPLTGLELIEKKVKMLSIMAGRFNAEVPEYNVMCDIPAAKQIAEQWPTETAYLSWELGDQVHYPAESIENDFSWTPAHPLKETYIRYGEMPYNNTMYDPTAVAYAVEPEYFTTGEAGVVTIDEQGVSRFTANPEGKAHVIYLSDEQAETLLGHFVDILTRKPACKN